MGYEIEERMGDNPSNEPAASVGSAAAAAAAAADADNGVVGRWGEDDTRLMLPCTVPGKIVTPPTPDQAFASSAVRVLAEGMCGAPMIDDKGRCAGVVEGIVPVDWEWPNHDDGVDREGLVAALRGSAVFIDGVDLGLLRERVEEEVAQLALLGEEQEKANANEEHQSKEAIG